jgi:hypothetical protein
MKRFVARFAPLVIGSLSGFDRLVFRGHLLPLMRPHGMHDFLSHTGVSLLDFGDYAKATSGRVKQAALAEARSAGRPAVYLSSSKTDKEDLAHQLPDQQPIETGPVCDLYVVEPCRSFEYHRDPQPDQRGLRLVNRKCLHVYQYHLHPTFGFLNARIQTWFPFNIQVCLNGREWLGRQLSAAGIAFTRHDNCFLHIADLAQAARLLDQQLATDWPEVLTHIARGLNPLHDSIFAQAPMDYYWSAYQTEWATDVMFRDAEALAGLYPALVRHALLHFQSPDIMRFLGRQLHPAFKGELTTSVRRRPEGVRVKHWVNGNSLKMYDKAGSILRVETTLANPDGFKVLRPPHDEPDGQLDWRPLRKGVADLHRRTELSQAANDRYLNALSVVDDSTPLATILDQVALPITWRNRRVRALRTGDPADLALLAAVSRGEFATAGLRNRDLRRLLHPDSDSAEPAHRRRLAARVGRQLRLLHAHGLIRKLSKTHRYTLTPKGHQLTAALSAARNATLKQLLRELP